MKLPPIHLAGWRARIAGEADRESSPGALSRFHLFKEVSPMIVAIVTFKLPKRWSAQIPVRVDNVEKVIVVA